MHAKVAEGFADVDVVPVRAFQQDVGGGVRDFGFCTTHDASNGMRTSFVTDQYGEVFEFMFFTIQGGEFSRVQPGVCAAPAFSHLPV